MSGKTPKFSLSSQQERKSCQDSQMQTKGLSPPLPCYPLFPWVNVGAACCPSHLDSGGCLVGPRGA